MLPNYMERIGRLGKGFWAAGLGTVLSAAASAGELPALSEDLYLDEVPIVLSATRLAQSIDDAGAAITVITREMILASGARDIPDLFRLVPGFVVGWANNDRVGASEHGLTSSFVRRMQVLVDGRSVYTPQFGGVPWAELPLAMEDIQRIEVVRGPDAASYGSSAFFGVVNIITRHAAEDAGWRATLRAGNDDVADGFLSYGGGGGALAWRTSFEYRQDHGQEGFVDERKLGLATLRADYQFDVANALSFQAGYNEGPRLRGTVNPDIPPRDQNNSEQFVQLRWEHQGQDGSSYWLQASRSQYYADQNIRYVFNALPGAPTVEPDSDIRVTRSDLEFEYTWRPFQELRLVAGAAARLDEVYGPLFFATPATLDNSDYRVFSSAEWRLSPRWLINLGAMLEDYELTGTSLAPRAAVSYRLLPEHTVRFGVSRATRVPVLYEEQGNMSFVAPDGTVNQATLASGGLNAETIDSVELGYLGHYLDGRLDVDTRLFYEEVAGVIAAERLDLPADYNGFAWNYSGNDDATLHGAELQLDYKLGPRHFYRLAYGYTEIDSRDLYQPLSYTTPQHNLSLLAAFPLPGGFDASAAWYYMSDRLFLPDIDAGLGGDILPDMRRLDLRVAHPFKAGKASGEVAVTVQNALSPYNEFQFESEFDTRAWLELRVNLP